MTRDPEWAYAGVHTAADIAHALAIAEDLPGDLMVIGGAQVYAAAMPYATEQVLSKVHLKPEGDVLYPAYDESEWIVTASEPHDLYERVFLTRNR
jgi:dihydrofolate reductase